MVSKARQGGWGRRGISVTILAALIATIPGCFSRSPNSGEEAPRIVWPPPPAEARIEYLQSFRTPGDLGIRKNWFVRFFRYFGRGRRPATMARPYSIAVASEGGIVVADPDNRCLHMFDPQRSKYRRLQFAGGGPLESPVGVAIDAEDRIYVADSRRRGIFRFDPQGEWIDSIGNEGDLLRPTGLALDRSRRILHVVDTLGHRVVTYDLEGSRLREFGSRGTGEGEFNFPVAAAVDEEGRIYVTDSMNFRVQIFDSAGRFLGTFGQAGNGPGDFDKAKGIAVDAAGHIYVVEALHDVVHVFDPDGKLLTILGGTGTEAGRFWLPAGIHIDREDRIWVADSANHRVQVLQVLGDAAGGDRG